MKWVKFAHDFGPHGHLHYLLKHGDKLVSDPGTKNCPADPNIVISMLHDPVIDSSFRIYNLTEQQFEGQYLDDRATYRDLHVFHRWDYEMEVPAPLTPKVPTGSLYLVLHHYELWAGGWIEFWDKEVRHGHIDHALYFKLNMRGNEKYASAYILQTMVQVGWNTYVNVASPPTSTDPPTSPGKPPY